MMTAPDKRGAALVGTMQSLTDWEAEVVGSLRLWCSGPAGHIKFWNRLVKTVGPDRARDEMIAFDRLVFLISNNAHRPLVRKSTTSRCICADEAMFLHLVSTATEGDLHEAAGAAALMVRAAHAEQIAILAAEVGETAKTVLSLAPANKDRTEDHKLTDNVVKLH